MNLKKDSITQHQMAVEIDMITLFSVQVPCELHHPRIPAHRLLEVASAWARTVGIRNLTWLWFVAMKVCVNNFYLKVIKHLPFNLPSLICSISHPPGMLSLKQNTTGEYELQEQLVWIKLGFATSTWSFLRSYDCDWESRCQVRKFMLASGGLKPPGKIQTSDSL